MDTMHTGTIDTVTSHRLASQAKCLHDVCECLITTGEHFCSDYCARQASEGLAELDEHCHCGHVDCAHEFGTPPMAVPIVGD